MNGEDAVSASNRIIKLARSLKARHGRDRHQCFLVEGARAVDELLDSSSKNVVAIIVEQAQREQVLLKACIHKAKSHNLDILDVDSGLFSALSNTPSPQGIMAVAKDVAVSLKAVLLAQPRLIVVSDGVQDPGNMGTLLRLADAVGADAFVATTGSVDMYNPKVVRASMSSLFHLSLCRDVEPGPLVQEMLRQDISIIAADPYASVDHFDHTYSPPLAVVFGNEGAGLSASFREQVQLVRIPMPGKAESLNVGVAAGILLYEIIRQWRSVASCGVMGPMI